MKRSRQYRRIEKLLHSQDTMQVNNPLPWGHGYKLSDSMCGFRAFRGDSLREMVPIFEQVKEPQYLASEMWIKFSQSGFSATEIPINLGERKKGFSYKGLYRYSWGVISTIIRSKLETYKYE